MTHNHTGKTCPFCQFPIKNESDIIVCSECGIPHHRECWQENGKCTTFGCREVYSQSARSTAGATYQPEAERVSLPARNIRGMAVAIILILMITFYGLTKIFGTGYLLFDGDHTGNEETIELVSKQPQQTEVADRVFELQGLVEVRDIDNTIEVELIYATEDNFTGQQLYDLEVCLLRRGTAEKLAAANAEFAEKGYRIKIWDAYRPRSVQGLMFEFYPNPVYVADPAVGSNHNRGTSVAITLVDKYGNELLMPTGFDDFTEKASRNYPDTDEEARKNVDYLTVVMIRHGFEPTQSKWWHFNDSDMNDYDYLDLPFEDWVNAYSYGE